MGNLDDGLSTRDFDSWMKGAVGMKHISLKRPCGEGLGGSSFTGEPGRYVKKVSGCGISLHGDPFPSEGNMVCVGAHILQTLTDE